MALISHRNEIYRKLQEELPDTVHLVTQVIDPLVLKLEIVAHKVSFLSGECFAFVSYNLIADGFLQEVVGEVKLQIEEGKDYVTLETLNNRTYMADRKRSLIKRVGSAGLELAFRISHLVGRLGNIRVFPANDAALFYFSQGFRFVQQPNLERRLQQLLQTGMQEIVHYNEPNDAKTPHYFYFTADELALYATLLEIDAEPSSFFCKKDQIMSLMLKHGKTPREGVSLPEWFRSTMYLSPEAIEEKRKQYLLL